MVQFHCKSRVLSSLVLHHYQQYQLIKTNLSNVSRSVNKIFDIESHNKKNRIKNPPAATNKKNDKSIVAKHNAVAVFSFNNKNPDPRTYQSNRGVIN